MDLIRDCAENVASHWQQLMLKMEDRLKLVNASVAFYKTSEQVEDPITLLSLFLFLLRRNCCIFLIGQAKLFMYVSRRNKINNIAGEKVDTKSFYDFDG